jgi:myo-inositol-1(or 4)-monophosphatase
MDITRLKQDVLTFMREAGQLAIQNQLIVSRRQKVDSTLVTETDLAITAFCRDHFMGYFSSAEHVLIDEESVSELGEPNTVFAKEARYHWVLDPIDGTVPYAAGRSGYGISLGILKDSKPWFGAIYYPGTGELIYGDVEEAFYVSRAFTREQRRQVLNESSLEPGPTQPLEVGTEIPLTYRIKDFSAGLISIQMASTVSFLNVLLGRATGYISHCALWDMAAGWPLMIAAGLELRWYKTQEVIAHITPEMLTNTWNLADDFIVSAPEHYATIRAALVPDTVQAA